MQRPNIDELLRDRKGVTGNYSCPVHISVEACLHLFEEAGIEPQPKTVGRLGDVLENFALYLLSDWSGRQMTPDDLADRLKKAIG